MLGPPKPFIMLHPGLYLEGYPPKPFITRHPGILEWGGDARTRDECQARGAGRAGPACPPCVRASVRPLVTRQKGAKMASESLNFH